MAKSKKLRILISAYACSPFQGSEPGLGWNIVENLGQDHEVHVITEEEKFRCDIEKKLNNEPALSENLNFYFIPKKRAKSLRKIWPPSYYWFYREWQHKAYKQAACLTSKFNFDVVHQFNMIGYREPGYLWKLKNIPLVWGPVGGFAQLKWAYIPTLSVYDMCYYTYKNIYNSIQMRTSNRVKKMATRADVIMSATIESQQKVKEHYGEESLLVNETGCNVKITDLIDDSTSKVKSEGLQIVWVGAMFGRKSLNLALEALAGLKDIPFKFHIIGDGDNFKKWKKLATSLGLSNKCTFYGRLSHKKTQQIMATSDAMLFPSLQEGTPHVVLESLSHGVPVICHDANGHGSVIDKTCGIKIPMENPKTSIEGFRKAVQKLYTVDNLLEKLSEGAKKKSKTLAWKNKADEIIYAYTKAISRHTK